MNSKTVFLCFLMGDGSSHSLQTELWRAHT